jgi:hypothetical protein
LPYKLEYYVTQGYILDWFKSYIVNRKKRIVLKSSHTHNFSSKWEIVKYGVPQGSVLSPLLFIIYIIYFTLKINTIAEVIIITDDTSISVCHDNYDEFKNMLNSVLLHISKWFRGNHLTLNVEKTNVLRCTPMKLVQYPLNLVYFDQTELDNLKFLGLLIDSHFTWKFHIDLLLHKMSTACCMVRKLSHVLGRDAIKSAYSSYSHSTIRYGIIFHGNSTNANRVFSLQKRVIRIMWE